MVLTGRILIPAQHSRPQKTNFQFTLTVTGRLLLITLLEKRKKWFRESQGKESKTKKGEHKGININKQILKSQKMNKEVSQYSGITE